MSYVLVDIGLLPSDVFSGAGCYGTVTLSRTSSTKVPVYVMCVYVSVCVCLGQCVGAMVSHIGCLGSHADTVGSLMMPSLP